MKGSALSGVDGMRVQLPSSLQGEGLGPALRKTGGPTLSKVEGMRDYLFEDIVRPLLRPHPHQHPAPHQVGQINAQRLGRHIGAKLLVFPVGD